MESQEETEPRGPTLAFSQFRYKGETYLAVPKQHDRPFAQADLHIVRQDGTNLGSYQSVPSFKKFIDNGDSVELGKVQLVVRVMS